MGVQIRGGEETGQVCWSTPKTEDWWSPHPLPLVILQSVKHSAGKFPVGIKVRLITLTETGIKQQDLQSDLDLQMILVNCDLTET